MLLATLLMTGCRGKPKKQQPPPRPVTVLRLEPQVATLYQQYVGRTEAFYTVDLHAQVTGYISAVTFREGQHVTRGQVLFRIDEAPFLAQMAAAQAQVARADADIARADAGLAQAEDAARRYAPLATTDAIPRQQYADALALVATRKAELAQAQASRQVAQVGLLDARIRLGYAVVRAPMSGIIGMRQMTVGALTTADSPQALATISQLDPIRVTFSVPDAEYLRNLAPQPGTSIADRTRSMQFRLELADGSVLPGSAKFYALERALNQQTDTMLVTVLYANPNDSLRPGEYVSVRSNVESARVLLVPVGAVRETQGTQLVWVLDANNTATQRTIRAQRRVGNAYAVESGLAPGDEVIVGGEQKLRPGDEVKPVLVSPQSLGETDENTGLGSRPEAPPQ